MKYSLVTASILGAATILGTVSGTAFAAEQGRTNPYEGDVTHQKTEYNLHVYSEPGYQGEAVKLNADQCTHMNLHGVEARSIRFRGNNCCFVFPTEDCSSLHAGQRVVGNVRDVATWGYPRAGAIKCLSQSACAVIHHGVCDLDASCPARAAHGPGAAQGRCPFEHTCSAYNPVHAGDWNDTNTGNPGAVVDRFAVDSDDGLYARQSFPEPMPAPASGPHHGYRMAGPSLATIGGTDDYARGPWKDYQDYPKARDARKAGERRKKLEKERAKEEKKRLRAKEKDAAYRADIEEWRKLRQGHGGGYYGLFLDSIPEAAFEDDEDEVAASEGEEGQE